MEKKDESFKHLVKNIQVNLEKWNEVTEFKDCPPLNKEVLAAHDDNIYIGVFEKDGQEGYCWKLTDEYGIQWVDIFVVECWLEI